MESQKDFENKVTEFIHRLPPMPGNVGELLNAANLQEMDDEELLAFVKQDPGLCADLLHLANTFSIRAEGHDDTIEEAVNSVGIKPLVQLIGVWYARNIIAKEFDMLDHLETEQQVIDLLISGLLFRYYFQITGGNVNNIFRLQ